MMVKKILLVILLITVDLYMQDQFQTFLSLKNTGVESFQQKYPDYDGRGTIILVLDTGVDMGVEGLTKTSTGETKVIDVQDFTGQGDVKYHAAEIEEIDDKFYFVNDDLDYKIGGADNLSFKAINDVYFIGVLNESLWINSSSQAGDMNGNGSKNDNFYFVVFEAESNSENFWTVYLDTDADGDLSDEKPLRSYKEKNDAFTIPNKVGLPKFTMGLNIFPESNTVSFVFDDGSHGTHCAGIAAGFRIGESDLYGVAPGANVIGLKLGNNNYSGGATVVESMKKSYLYADKISKEREEPCIINMSFGIGSEIEGQADIEIFLKELTEKNPYLYIATSNGNEGPGLSTSGMPSASDAIFSTGAVLSKEVGNDLYSTTLDKDIILHFSSRGGEVAKPDVVAPGACVSTVPNFSKGDRFWGTSMASPYSAGVMAVLLGAARIEYPDIKIPSQLLYKILRESAQPIKGYDYLDQGAGLINIEKAHELLKKYIESNELDRFTTYKTYSFAPNMPKNSAPSLYIRDGSYLKGNEKFYFKIVRNETDASRKFYRIYNLSSSADWLQPINTKVHIRNDQPAYVSIIIDDSILTKPGLYNGKITATRNDESGTHEFDLMSTIVIPNKFSDLNSYSLNFDRNSLDPGMHKRYFLKIPFGASNLNINLYSNEGEYTYLRYYLHDPDGREVLYGSFNSEKDGRIKNEKLKELFPGVYEFVVLGEFTSFEKSYFDLEVEIGGINILGHSIIDNSVTIANFLSTDKRVRLDGDLLGYQKKFEVDLAGKNEFVIPFKLKAGETKKEFDVSLSKEDFNKVTDFALMIYDSSGRAKRSSGLSYKDGTISITRTKSTETVEFKFVIIPGLTHALNNISAQISERTYIENPIKMEIKHNEREDLIMYPDINYKLDVNFIQPVINLNSGEHLFCEIRFISTIDNKVEYSKILTIKNKE